jgi:5-formyltetrahydrofolate cyclo-ligase
MAGVTTLPTKASLREAVRASRRSGPAADPTELADRVMEFLDSVPGPQRLSCYSSYGTEPDTGALRERLAAAGYTVVLPRVAGAELEWVVDHGPLIVSAMGIEEPTGPTVDLLPVRVMLVPALAVSPSGMRLGKGGGYYDRTLSRLGTNRPIIAALRRDEDVVDDVPTDAYDAPVDVIITPTRVMECGG